MMTHGSPNKERPHLFVLPEDQANTEIANGFLKSSFIPYRAMKVLNNAGGWRKVLDVFESAEIAKMRKYPERFMVLLFDFDNHPERIDDALNKIPHDLQERVFVLGSLSDPQSLTRAGLGKPEEIGLRLAKACQEEDYEAWGHNLLKHNGRELDRLRRKVRPFLFGGR